MITDEQWLLIAVWAAGALGVGIATLVTLLRLLRETRAERSASEHLARIEKLLTEFATREEGLDLRRLEHVLLDIRDGQKRVEERVMSVLEARGAARVAAGPHDSDLPSGIGERVVTRLVALGYERIEILTGTEELERARAEGGEIAVEARRGGALHKGHVTVSDGTIADVHLRSIYEAFP